MKQSNLPIKVDVVWASAAGAAYVREVPDGSLINTTPGAASWSDGFVPLNMTAKASGGVPPAGQDTNGVLRRLSSWVQYITAAGVVPYDATFQNTVGGYPLGAVVATAYTGAAGTTGTLGRMWVSIVDGNTTNPDTGGAGWLYIPLPSDVLALIFANAVRLLPSGPIYYVSPTGSDSNDGLTTATPLLTPQAAVTKCAALYVPGGSATIQLIGYSGTQVTFPGPSVFPMSTPVTIIGDNANLTHYRLTGGTSASPVGVQGAQVTLQGLELYNAGSTYNTLSVVNGAVTLKNVGFNGVGGSTFSHMVAFQGGTININGSIQFSCNAQVLFSAFNGGQIVAGAASGTVISTTQAITFTYNVRASALGLVSFTLANVSFSGSFTGTKYLADLNAVLNCGGSSSSIPGGTAGSTSTGGQAY